MNTRWSVADTVRHITAGEITATQVAEATLACIEAVDDELGAFLVVDGDGARAAAAEIDRMRAAGEPLGPLAGVPVALKDVLVTRGLQTTAASKILEGWIPPYDAHVVESCARRAPSSSARSTATSSRWAAPPRTAPTS